MPRLNMSNDTSVVRGIVVINEDPEKRGRIKVRIPTYHGIPNESKSWITDEDLPWALPGIFPSAGNDLGMRLIPTVGTRIFVMFEDGDWSRPVYFGGIPLLIGDTKYYNTHDNTVLGSTSTSVSSNDTMLDINTNHTQSSQGIIFKSLKGFTIYYDDTDGDEQVKIIDQAGQVIKMISLDPVLSRRGNKEIPDTRSQIAFNSGDTSIQIGNIDLVKDNQYSYEEGIVFTLPSDELGD